MKRTIRFLFPMLAGAALLVTLLRPETGWLARHQLGSVLSGSWGMVQTLSDLGLKRDEMPLSWALPPAQPERIKAAYAHALVTHPADTELQIAGILHETWGGARLTALRNLPASAPRNAVILRLACQNDINLKNRQIEQDTLSSTIEKRKDEPVDSAALEAALKDAQGGAVLDPSNAFFPAMEAIALYGLKRDSEARAALHRAALAPHYDDGTRTETEGTWRLREIARGPQLALTETAVAAAILFP
ncbi:hypothetical protein, partial [Armatimonas sp.]|uniref:hypothetical protein n=1 Tax=Armatimonas sp. TaxID=1872638 RepID=UPI00286C45C0